MSDFDSVLVDIPVDREVVDRMREIARTDVPDLPDRIIAATAVRLGVPVISRDAKIKAANLATVW